MDYGVMFPALPIKRMRITSRIVLSLAVGLVSFFATSEAHTQEIEQLAFQNQPIVDILLVLARASGETIVPDETVSGRASYYFDDTDFDTALRVFLETYGLQVWREDGVYYVSRVRAESDPESSLVTIRAIDVPMETAITRLARSLDVTVLYDRLPNELISINAVRVSPEIALEILIRRFSEYELLVEPDYFYVRRISSQDQGDPAGLRFGEDVVTRDGDSFSVTGERIRFFDLIEELFRQGEQEYSMLKRSDQVIERVSFSERSFDELLRLILEQADADFTITNDVYYIFDVNRNDVLKKFDTTMVVALRYVSAREVPELFPAGLASSNLYRIDSQANAIILSGSHEEIEPVRRFVTSIDRPLEGRTYHRFDLTHISVENAISALPESLQFSDTHAIAGSNSFVMLLSPHQHESIESYLTLIDISGVGFPINLRYIKTEDLLSNLPPSVRAENVHATSTPTRFFFSGSAAQRELFLRELAFIDRPTPQVRYELLVLQFQESDARDWDFDITARESQDDDDTMLLGSFTSLLNLNFDVLSTFGTTFALQLNWELSRSRAGIVADTTLNGLSGEQISFQNTNTFRYRDQEIDPDTGEQRSTGVTRELTSGLLVDINGWVSGDGMITMEISSTISRQGTTSATDDNPPPTSERVITTHVRTASGEPVVISGLVQEETTLSDRRVPILWRIPLLGRLFRDRSETIEETELAIYIVPYVEYTAGQEESVETAFESLYRELVAR